MARKTAKDVEAVVAAALHAGLHLRIEDRFVSYDARLEVARETAACLSGPHGKGFYRKVMAALALAPKGW